MFLFGWVYSLIPSNGSSFFCVAFLELRLQNDKACNIPVAILLVFTYITYTSIYVFTFSCM